MDKRLLTAREVARLLHVSLSYAYVLMRRGDLRSIRIGTSVRVRREDLEGYISEHFSKSALEFAARREQRNGGR